MNVENLIDLEPNEKVVYFLRRHWIIFFGDMLTIAFLAVVPFGCFFLIDRIWPTMLVGALSRPILILLVSAYYLMIWLFFINTFVDYYLDAWAITSDRVVNVEQHGLFNRTISELDLTRVQDVTSEVKGVLPSIFNYGDILIQTAGEAERFDFEQVHRPHDIRKHILELVETAQKRKSSPPPAAY